jgi:uncharacterized damage-inducible protein DinB
MEIPKKILVPVHGLTKEVGLLVAALEEVRSQTIGLLSDLSVPELSLRPAASVHQIGGLALHLGECEFWWIEVGFAKKEITDQDRRFAHLNDTTETDFALKNYTAADCAEILGRIHARAVTTLSGYTDDDLDVVFSNDRHPNGFEGSLRWILHRLIDHEANHKGQIAMIKRLIREGEVPV